MKNIEGMCKMLHYQKIWSKQKG